MRQTRQAKTTGPQSPVPPRKIAKEPVSLKLYEGQLGDLENVAVARNTSVAWLLRTGADMAIATYGIEKPEKA